MMLESIEYSFWMIHDNLDVVNSKTSLKSAYVFLTKWKVSQHKGRHFGDGTLITEHRYLLQKGEKKPVLREALILVMRQEVSQTHVAKI